MLTVLVVEDEFGVADVVMTALEDEGYRVLVAPNGKQGLERLQEAKPDLLIVDFMMPIMDGAALGHAVRSSPQFANIPIIMTSAVGEAAVKQRFAEYSIFLRKPFRIRELVEAVRSLIGG